MTESRGVMPRSIAMRTLPLLLLAAACHRGAAPTPAIGATAPGTAPAPGLFAGLFAGDRTAIYDVTRSRSHWDDQDPAADANGMVTDESTEPVTCRVDVETVGPYRTATVTCDDDDDAPATLRSPIFEKLEASYVTDDTRLWRVDLLEAPITVADVQASLVDKPDLVLGQAPVHEEDEDEEEPRFGSVHEVVVEGDGWCVGDGSWGGDEGGSSYCISAARGLTKVTWYFAGGESHDEDAVLRE